MAKHPRFRPDDLDAFANPQLRPALGVGGSLVWRYTILFPVAEGKSGEEPRTIDTAVELFSDLIVKLAEHFQGLSVLPPLQGHGLRDANDPSSSESNINVPLHVYSAPVGAA